MYVCLVVTSTVCTPDNGLLLAIKRHTHILVHTLNIAGQPLELVSEHVCGSHLTIILCIPEVQPVAMLRCIGVRVGLAVLPFVVCYGRHLLTIHTEHTGVGSFSSVRNKTFVG